MKRGNTFSISKTAEELVPDLVSRGAYFVAVGASFVLLLCLFLVWGKLPTIVPLFFTEPWGEARLVGREWLILLPGLSMITIVINVIIGKIAGKLSPLLPRMLGVTSAVVALAMLMSLLGIVQSLTL